ncbi:MAG: hypothetical protein P8L85_14625 [Rubripirellula sp.]|nr:hypothetical protein [Rubripirellula sp.]
MLPAFTTRSKSGITLFEVIIVIGLLAASAAATLIMLDGRWRDRRLVVAATNDLANYLQTARNTAVSNRAAVSVQRSQAGTTEKLLITEDAGPFRGSRSWVVEISDVVDLLGNPTTIQFSSAGKPDKKVKWKVRHSGLTGTVTMLRGWNQVMRKYP